MRSIAVGASDQRTRQGSWPTSDVCSRRILSICRRTLTVRQQLAQGQPSGMSRRIVICVTLSVYILVLQAHLHVHCEYRRHRVEASCECILRYSPCTVTKHVPSTTLTPAVLYHCAASLTTLNLRKTKCSTRRPAVRQAKRTTHRLVTVPLLSL